MEDHSDHRNSNAQFLQEIEALSRSLHQSHTTRRAASLAIPYSSDPIPTGDDGGGGNHSRRHDPPSKTQNYFALAETAATGEKKGIWSWKPMRALSHIGMRRLACLFSVEVIALNRLPASMNGLRLSVAVRKKETKDGAVQTMPSRVLQGSADFEETLFVRCHVYCTGGGGTGKRLKFEPRLFLVSTVAIDAPELDLGRPAVDLSLLVQESIENSLQWTRARQWDATFELSGKAKGGELVTKLGFQIMDDGGVGVYRQAQSMRWSNKGSDSPFPSSRKQSKYSFSIASPRAAGASPPMVPSIDRSSYPFVTNSELKSNGDSEDLDILEFDVVDKGIEIQAEPEEPVADGKSISAEVVKQVLHDPVELDSIAKQIKALASTMAEDVISPGKAEENEAQRLDAEEETVTKEFLQMLEVEDGKESKSDTQGIDSAVKSVAENDSDDETMAFLPDLAKGLGSVVQTRDGGFLVAMNPLDMEVPRKDTPKLAFQVSRPFVLRDQKHTSGFEVFQSLAAMGWEELGSELASLTAMDELTGKTAERIAFEGIASAVISGRNKEGASSSAARSIAAAKAMAAAMVEGRRERISTGIWSVREDPVTAEEILGTSLQKMEAMAVEALKIQAEMAEEEAPFDISPLVGKEGPNRPLDSAISIEEWAKACSTDSTVTLLAIIQLRDPLRRFEAVGAPVIAVVQAARVGSGGGGGGDEEGRFKVRSLHMGGLKLRSGGQRSTWDGEKPRLAAMQWLVAHGLGKARKKQQPPPAKVGHDSLWIISSRVMADMFLHPMRKPDVKFP